MKNVLDSRLRELTVLLGEMRRLHEELLGAARGKLEAMRAAAPEVIQQEAARERALADAITEREGLRAALMERIGDELDVEPARARRLTLGQLADRVPEPRRGQLHVLGQGLRELAGEIGRVNRIGALVGREMLNHFRELYATMTEGVISREVYDRTGRAETASAAAVIDTRG